MQRIKIVGLVALLALVAMACGGDDDEPTETGTATGTTDGGTATGATGALAEFGETTDADPALVDKALGPVDAVG